MAKTDWQLNDTVTPADMNQIGQEINQNSDDIGELQDELNSNKADYVRHPGYAVTTGVANYYNITVPNFTKYVEGACFALKISIDNTGPSYLNVNGLGNKIVKKSNGTDFAAGQLKAGSIYTFRDAGSAFILQGEGGEYGTAGPAQVLSGYTIGTEKWYCERYYAN